MHKHSSLNWCLTIPGANTCYILDERVSYALVCACQIRLHCQVLHVKHWCVLYLESMIPMAIKRNHCQWSELGRQVMPGPYHALVLALSGFLEQCYLRVVLMDSCGAHSELKALSLGEDTPMS